MSHVAPTRRHRLGIAGIWAASTVGAVALVLATLPLPTQELDVTFMLALTALAVDVEVFASVGAVLAIRRPGNQVGYVLLAAGALLALTFCGFVFGAGLTLINGSDDLAAGLASMVGGLTIYTALVVAGPALAIVFPDGRLPGRRWRWATAVIVSMLTLGFVLALVRPGPVNDGLAINPFGIPGDGWSQWGGVGLLVSGLALVVSLILGIVAVVVRYQRGTGVERAQLRWFLASNVATAILLCLTFLDGSTGSPTIIDIMGVLSLGLPPIAVGLAVMRYRLYEIDRIISRTIAYACVTAILVATYAGAIIVLQGPLGNVVGGDTVSVALSTLVVAALFQPIRMRVQRAVDRRFDRARFDVERTVDAFAEQLRDEVDLVRLRRTLVATAADAMHPVSAAVWLRAESGAGR